MTAPLSITTSQDPDGAAVLTVTGEIDMSNAGALAEALDAVPGRVVLDLSGVGYLDSAGLAVLFGHADRIELVANPNIGPVLTVSGLTDLTAVRGLASGSP